jgi:heme A synthase
MTEEHRVVAGFAIIFVAATILLFCSEKRRRPWDNEIYGISAIAFTFSGFYVGWYLIGNELCDLLVFLGTLKGLSTG